MLPHSVARVVTVLQLWVTGKRGRKCRGDFGEGFFVFF